MPAPFDNQHWPPNGKDPTERRSAYRYRPPDKTFVLIEEKTQIIGEIINISQNGIRFKYISNVENPDDHKTPSDHKITIFNTEEGFFLSTIKGTLLYETRMQLTDPTFSYLPIKKCGLRFCDIDGDQRQMLQNFISRCKPYRPDPSW